MSMIDFEGSVLNYTIDLVKAEKWFNTYRERDEQARIDSKDEPAIIHTMTASSGIYLCEQGREIPVRYIEKITVIQNGEEPCYLGQNRFMSGNVRCSEAILGICENGGKVCAAPASNTVIEVVTISGNKYTLSYSRHAADRALAAIMDIWHEHR